MTQTIAQTIIQRMAIIIYLILFLQLNNCNALKKALLQCNFNSQSECISLSLTSLESFLKNSQTFNVELKTFLYKSSTLNENHYFYDIYDKLNDNHNKKSYFSKNCMNYNSLNRYKGFPLLSIMESQYFKRILHPSLILNKTKKDLLKIFHRNVIDSTDNLIMISVILPSKIYMLANSDINYIIDSEDTRINSKNYSINYSLWKINNFVNIQFGNFIQ